MNKRKLLEEKGLYDPRFEHDSCGVGFVCNIDGNKTNKIVNQGLEVLRRLSHRGATGADPKTGDGAGILIQMPHKFFVKTCEENRIKLPEQGLYGTGLIFLPQNKKERELCKDIFKKVADEEGCNILGWRKVPIDNKEIGKTALESEPVIEQIFIGENVTRHQPPATSEKELEFERVLYVIRKKIENTVRLSKIKQRSFFYITNLSSRTFSYKGLLMPDQVEKFFIDLKDINIESALCIVHSRYSTNTFPTWDLSQPFRFIAHNGEINTLRGNINWMRAREGLLKNKFFKKDISSLKPVIVPGGSDSASFDNLFELLLLSGRNLPDAMMMLIPEAWEHNDLMDQKLKEFYKYHACVMEPWDGPAAMAFTDGTRIGAVLDRNGLRPARFIITKDNFAVMSSEAGVLDIEPSNIALSGRLEPGKMFYIDTKQKRIISDDEIKKGISNEKSYGAWLKKNLVELEQLSTKQEAGSGKQEDILTSLKAFGYTREDLKFIMKPMAEEGKEPVGSMGNDTPHAVLSKNPQLLYAYFKQLFAQVTNPPIDPIREELVMSLYSFIGRQENILTETEEHCRKLFVKEPVLLNEDLEKIREFNKQGFRSKTISILFGKTEKEFIKALDRIKKEAESAIKEGYSFIILSDKGINRKLYALPALLAIGAVHQYLVKKALRAQLGIILQSAEPREVHHFALLFGYGADCINPYFAYETVKYLVNEGELKIDTETALKNYRKSVGKGILKILSKMGISTLQSYRGAQIFEAVGIGAEIIDKCFTGTVSRISGIGLSDLCRETITRFDIAFSRTESATNILATGGTYQWKRDGEFHLWNPDSISALQDAARENNHKKYKEFAGLINDQSGNPTTIRGLFKFNEKRKAIPIDEVESGDLIFKRFVTGAMSFGSISKSAHETLALVMNKLGGKSNTGEGGEDPVRFAKLPNGDSLRSAIKQVASGRFGVTTNYLVNADEIQIKISQGAKPGEGGQLPGHKVSATIAKIRYTTPGVTLISPPPHHDIYSIEDLAQLIFDLKNVNPKARISVKLVSEIGVGTVAAGVAKGHADMILISGGDGGTGASPLSSIKHAGLPWELGLSETHQTLVLNDLRSRVRLQTDGQMRTGRDVAIAAILGAEEFGFCTSALVVLGCVMLRHCHLNTCSMGVATQDEILQKRFRGKPEYLINYFNFVVQELREIMANLGIRKIDEMIGQTDLISMNNDILPVKAKNVNLSRILYKPETAGFTKRYCTEKQDHGIEGVLDHRLIELAEPALRNKTEIRKSFDIRNYNRATGAMLSGEVIKRLGEDMLSEDTINFKFKGVAGQSFGAFLVKGITFELEGMANDYAGKGISGGKIIMYPDEKTVYKPSENIIIGNTSFYGAISGEAYIRGRAGERFCIRNSGLNAVVEGVGDHGLEYMTGGRIIVLGKTGRNFAAGMSGGISYVYDEDGDFKSKCNLEMIEFEEISEEDKEYVFNLLSNHFKYTKSSKTKEVLYNFNKEIQRFVKVIPVEYKKIIEINKFKAKTELNELSDG